MNVETTRPRTDDEPADDRARELLRRLSLAAGPPGAEDEVRAIVRETLAAVGTLAHDRLGSVLCEKRGTSAAPRIMLDSHLDEIGFLVQSIDRGGRLALVPLGGWWGHVLPAQRVEVLSRSGRLPGVIASKPPHFLTEGERKRVQKVDELFVDLGASSREQVAALGVGVGDPVVPAGEFRELAIPGVLSGKAFDNRAGVALMCETLLALGRCEHPNTVIGVGAVQEELGARGAGTASHVARPDLAIVLECTPADDVPGQSEPQAVLGAGPQLRLFDPTAVGHRRLVRFVESVAGEIGVPLQLAVRRSGGTDAGAIHRHGAGVPSAVIGVPARYIHTHAAILRFGDFLATRRLVLACIERLDAERVDELTRF